MSETKHTPGPWFIEPTFASSVNDGQGRYICAMSTTNALGGQDVRAANAHLIAAAPDLLEACQATARRLELVADLFAEDDADTILLRQLREVIKKAKGEATP